MALDISTQHDFGDFKDCVEWSKPEKFTPDELEAFAAKVLERTEPKSKEETTPQIQEVGLAPTRHSFGIPRTFERRRTTRRDEGR